MNVVRENNKSIIHHKKNKQTKKTPPKIQMGEQWKNQEVC